MESLTKEILEVYGLAGLFMLYLLKKDWDSQSLLKQLVEKFGDKVKHLIDLMGDIRKLINNFTTELEELKKDNKILQEEVRDLREYIKRNKRRDL